MNRFNQAKDFFDGKLSPEEAASFLEWYLSREGEEELHLKIDELWCEWSENDKSDDWDPSTLFSRIQQTKENQVFLYSEQAQDKSEENKPNNISLIKKYMIAASLSLLLITSAILLGWHIFKPGTGARSAVQLITKANPAGQKSRIQLPDGSIVSLNAASSISYATDFIVNRKLSLEGEAFFEVKKDPGRPFSVASGRLITTALGTSFNINAFDQSSKLEVVLVSGTVRVEDKVTNKSLLLNPNELIEVKGDNASFDKRKAGGLENIAWKDGVIWFSETPFNEVVTTLERWYDADIEIFGEPGNFKCSGKFENQSLEEVLESLSYTAGFNFEMNRKKIKLLFNVKEKI